MKKIVTTLILFLFVSSLNIGSLVAQGSPDIRYFAGFDMGLKGVDFNYRSPLPTNEDAFILRNSFENREMTWKTAPVTLPVAAQKAAFVFMAAMSTDQPDLEFSLQLKDGELFKFFNNQEKSWTIKGSMGGELSFFQAKNLTGIEINGFMILKVPADRIKPNETLDMKITLLPTGRNAWIIIFKKPLQTSTMVTNSPVLVKSADGLKQQLTFTQIQFNDPGRITFSSNGRELMTSQTKIGFNRFFVPVPMVTSPKKITVSIISEAGLSENLSIVQLPVKKWEIYLVQHAHTDIGYTRPQSEILAEHLRYIDYALDYCDLTDNLPDDARFRWTCESAWVVREYMRIRPQARIEQFKKRINEGRIEVTGMYFNMSEIADENIMFDFFQPLKEIVNQGISVKTMMQNDVNGVAWCLPDYLKNTGVKYLSMGINEARSIRPFQIPTCFWWESPSGARLLAYRSDHYMTGNNFGLPDPASFDPDKVFEYLRNLESEGYPFDRVAAQFSGYFTDNAPPSTGASQIVKDWNEKYESPKLRLAVASEFLQYVEENYSKTLPVYKKAWLDWWTDGFGSTSRETAVTRKTQNAKQVDEGLFAMVSIIGGDLSDDLESKNEHISENALFFDEHTVGADESIDHPFSENSTGQWLQKGAYAWEALKKVTLLHEDALGRVQQYLKKADFPLIYVMNPMGWDRSGVVELFVDYQIIPLGKPFRIIDLDTGEDIGVQMVRSRSEGAYWALQANNIPALGWKACKVEVGNGESYAHANQLPSNKILENRYYSITIDAKNGAIKSLFDKEMNKELVDKSSPWQIGQLVHETLTDRNNMSEKTHTSVSNVIVREGSEGDLWQSLKFSGDLAGFEMGSVNSPKGLEWEVRLYHNIKVIEFYFMGRKEILTDPEALYVTFPFNWTDSHIVFETIGGTLSQGQQLPGSSSDWNVAQDFVSVRNSAGQIVLVSDEIPLWQFGGFNLGNFERYPKSTKPWLNSWVMNNYWTTNFRAFQEGAFHWTYQITTMKDTTNSAASRFARSVRNPFPTRTFPAGKNELTAPAFKTVSISGTSNVMIVNSRPAFDEPGSIIVHLREMDGKSGAMTLKSAIEGRPIREMFEVSVIGEKIGQPIKSVSLNPFEVKFIELVF